MGLAGVAALFALPGWSQEEDGARTFEKKLATHPFFSKIELERVESHPPYLFLVQKPPRPDARRAETLAVLYTSIFDPVLERFEREVAEPSGLQQRADRERFTVVILASQGDFSNYQNVTRSAWHLNANAHHDRTLNAAVLFDDVFQPARAPGERALSARHAFVHLCQQAWHAGGVNAPLESWVLEGMADAWARREEPGARAKIYDEWLRLFVGDAQDERRRWTNLRTLGELILTGEAQRLEALLRKRMPKDAAEIDVGEVWWAYYRQASLMTQFLSEAEDGKRRSLALDFVLQALGANRSDGASIMPLTGLDAAELERSFLAWVLAEHRAHLPKESVDEALFARALLRGPGGAPDFSTGEAAADSAAPALAALDLGDATDDERFALALRELSLGRSAAGIAALEALLARTNEAGRERVRRELGRARTWDLLARGFLAGLAEKGGTLELQRGGKKVRGKVLAFVDGELRLETSKAQENVRLEEIPALELAQQMKSSGGPDDWARFYAYVLAGDARAKKLLKEDGGEGSALLRDARDDYPARLALARVAGELLTLESALPETPSAVRTALSALRAWRESARGLPLLERKQVAVRQRARELLLQEVRLLGSHTFLAGTFEALGGERVRISYDFKDARELADFEAGRYPPLVRKGCAPAIVETEPFAVEGGRLVTAGETSLRSLFELGAPLTVRYSLEYADRGHHDGANYFAVGVCDDGQEHFLWGINFRDVQLYDPAGNATTEGEAMPFFFERSYEIELRHDGKLASSAVEGVAGPTLDATLRTQGAVFLFAHCNTQARVERLVIEGRLLPNSFERLAAAGVERELARDF
jgi:hypothetical protein